METNIAPAAGTSPAPVTPPPAAPDNAPAPVAPVAPEPVVSAKPEARDILGVLSPVERRQLTTGQKTFKDIIAARPAKPGETPAAAPVASTPPPAPTPDPAPAPEPTPDPAAPVEPAELPDRFRFKETEDQTIALIAKTKGISLREAARLYDADHAPAAPAAPVAPAPPPEDPDLKAYDTQIGELTNRITKLSESRKKAIEEVENEKAYELSDQIADVKADLRLLQNERTGFVRQREQAGVQDVERQTLASHARAFDKYPELKVEGSMPRLALEQYVARALANPKRAHEFRDPTWPERLTEEFATAHSIKSGTAAPTPAPVPAPATRPATSPTPQPVSLTRPRPQQVPGAKLVDGADGSQPSASNGKPTQADLMAALPGMTPAQRRELIRLSTMKRA